MDKDKGVELLSAACDAIAAKIKENGGDMAIKVAVRTLSLKPSVSRFT